MAEKHPYIGPKIRYHRKARGWTLRELGRRSDVAFGLIGAYERRDTAPQFVKLARIAKALGVPLDHLSDMNPPPEAKPRAKAHGRRKPRGALKIVR